MDDKDKAQIVGLAQFDGKKDQILDLWFHDSIEFAHGCKMSIKIKDVLCHYRSRFQEIAIFDTDRLGRMLVLDNITMLTEFDEFAYHEMIAHVPLLVHPNPSKILVIGGGDGGTVREILKHRRVEQVRVCEIDEEVVKACRKFLPSLAACFDDPRVEILYEDGARYVQGHQNTFDIIIVDSTDPVGPGQILFQRKFYEDMKKALSEDGIAVTQCESMFFHQDVIRSVSRFVRDLYPKSGYYYTLVPVYPSGVIGFFFCSLKYDPLGDLSEERVKSLKDLKYYTPAVHKASFTLPRFGAELVRAP
jgi:spermidine synthase